MTGTRAPARPLGPRGQLRRSTSQRLALAALLVLAGCAFALLEPWHGPTVLALSEEHGIDLADLPAVPLIAVGLAVAPRRVRAPRTDRRWWDASGLATALALGLSAVLVAGLLDPRVGGPLVPAGGATLSGYTGHVDGRRAEPVGRWTHLAVTYDGSAYRLYVNGTEVSSAPASGTILRTADPLWIGGNRPYGEYFQGVIDEVRVYRRALSPGDVRVAMSTPLGPGGGRESAGLAAAYGFDAGAGRLAADVSGNRNTGVIHRARWTRAGRFGAGLRFAGSGAVVRIPASASLDLRSAMTLMAWIKPSEIQGGWRTVLARQTDAYSLVAGGGRQNAGTLERLDRVRFALVILLVLLTAAATLAGGSTSSGRRGRWSVAVVLFVAGALVDVAFAPSDTLFAPALVAIWCAATASRPDERLTMYALAAAFVAATLLVFLAPASLPLPRDDGGVVRSAALGLILGCAALVTLVRRGPRARAG